MDVVAQQHSTGHIGGIVVACAQALEGGFFVAEGAQKGEGKLSGIKGLQGQIGDGGFYFYGVHGR